jgi:hypothetical protein
MLRRRRAVIGHLLPGAAGALLLAFALWAATPSWSMDANTAYEVVTAFPQYPLRGPQAAPGLLLWNHGVNGHEAQYQYPPPLAVETLASHGWDTMKINRNPAFEGGWITTGQQHVNMLVQQVLAAQRGGYSRIIVGGYSYGGAIALEAAIKVPVYGVIAMVPGIGQPKLQAGGASDSHSADIVQYTLAQIRAIRTSRALFVLPPDDELLPGYDQAPAVRQEMNARGLPYMLVDRQVHGHNGGYTPAFWPYASCGVIFFSPSVTPHAGEFQCYRDELVPLLASFGLSLNGVIAAWIGYLDKTGQPVIVLEHRTSAGSTVDFAIGGDLLGRSQAQAFTRLPARWTAGQLGIWVSRSDVMTLYPSAGTNTWRFLDSSTIRGDWAGSLAMLAVSR